MKDYIVFLVCAFAIGISAASFAADIVPNEVQLPGTQPSEVGNLESPGKCDNCHGGYDTTVEPAHNWRGSMMANAGRDPIFWATVAVAEQAFDGVGDLCIRCHSTGGWLAGRSTPTDGSGLAAGDSDGVECDYCHKLTNPNNSEILGVQNAPFIANDEGNPTVGYYGSGMSAVNGGNEKLGPYIDAEARHKFIQSQFHRSVDFCGTCHDVSNSVVGDLAEGNGIQDTADPVVASGVPGSPLADKAAFNNFPYQYGIVERTFSEHVSGGLSGTLVSEYSQLPEELQGGAIKAAYESAVLAGTGGNYEDGSDRFFTCQTCHMRPVNGFGCNKKGAPIRKDLPLHDMTGGNYWMPDAIVYQDSQAALRLGGGLTATQLAALEDGKTRAMKQLSEAVSLQVSGDVAVVVNQTGHKAITGYPEGRRMWLNIKWHAGDGQLVAEEGAYGPVTVSIDGSPIVVNTLLDRESAHIYEAHYGMTQEWASQLVSLGYPPDMALSFDHITGERDYTLGDLASQALGTTHETFHFALNNTVVKDNRIPPYQMSYEKARARNALPVPADQYGNPGPGGFYDHWDEVALIPPPGATYATIELLYQPTSWEYVQFLYLANTRQNAFLADEGANLLDAWLNTGMAAPYTMASTTWGAAPVPPTPDLIVDDLSTWEVTKQGNLTVPADTFGKGDTVGILATTIDQDGLPVAGSQIFAEIRDGVGEVVASLQGFSDEAGEVVLKWKTSRKQVPGTFTVIVKDVINNGYQFNPENSVVTVLFTIQ
jgi:hypothetical protein